MRRLSYSCVWYASKGVWRKIYTPLLAHEWLHSPGCRHVCRALSLGLSASRKLGRESACPECVMVLLTLAFPSQIHLPRRSSLAFNGLGKEPTVPVEPTDFDETSATLARQTRESALSCICSILQVNYINKAGCFLLAGKDVVIIVVFWWHMRGCFCFKTDRLYIEFILWVDIMASER